MDPARNQVDDDLFNGLFVMYSVLYWYVVCCCMPLTLLSFLYSYPPCWVQKRADKRTLRSESPGTDIADGKIQLQNKFDGGVHREPTEIRELVQPSRQVYTIAPEDDLELMRRTPYVGNWGTKDPALDDEDEDTLPVHTETTEPVPPRRQKYTMAPKDDLELMKRTRYVGNWGTKDPALDYEDEDVSPVRARRVRKAGGNEADEDNIDGGVANTFDSNILAGHFSEEDSVQNRFKRVVLRTVVATLKNIDPFRLKREESKVAGERTEGVEKGFQRGSSELVVGTGGNLVDALLSDGGLANGSLNREVSWVEFVNRSLQCIESEANGQERFPVFQMNGTTTAANIAFLPNITTVLSGNITGPM